ACSSACCSCSPPRRARCSRRKRSCRPCGTSSTTRSATTPRCSRTSCGSAACSARMAPRSSASPRMATGSSRPVTSCSSSPGEEAIQDREAVGPARSAEGQGQACHCHEAEGQGEGCEAEDRGESGEAENQGESCEAEGQGQGEVEGLEVDLVRRAARHRARLREG